MPNLVTCEVCNKNLRDKYKLKRHMLSHTDVRPFGCGVCGKRFRRQYHLTEHTQSHSGQGFSCPECGKTCTRYRNLRHHIENAHPNPTIDVTTESHEEPAGTVTTTTHSFSTDSGTTSISYIQSPNTERKAPVQVVTQSIGPVETTTVTQSSGRVTYIQSFDVYQEELARGLPNLE